MNITGREIEKKYVINERGMFLDDAYDIILSLIAPTSISHCINPCGSSDFYWKAPNDSSIQFVRLRDSWGRGSDGFSRQLQEITVKAKDKNNNVDRLEYNLNISEPKTAKSILNLLFGKSVLLEKEECVIFIKEAGSAELVISLAQIKGEKQIYLEIEGQSEEVIDLYAKKLQKKLVFKQEQKSLYELYIERKL